MCTCAFAPPASLWILCCDNLARKTAIHLIFPNDCWLCFYHSLHYFMPGEHNTPFFHFLNFGSWFVDLLLRSLHCSARKPFFRHLGYIQPRCMSDCSSCTQPPCLAIAADMLKTYKKLVADSWVRIGCYLNHIRLRSLLSGLYSLFRPFQRTFLTKFVCENPRTDHMLIFNFADCADLCLGRPWKFPVPGSDELVMKLSTYPSFALYC